LLDGLLRKQGIDFLSVSGRTKTRKGVLEKIKRKKYKNPAKQLTDVAGIRIITFLESGVDRTSELICSSFDVDEANSLDKSAVLGVDQIGYRSVHFVCGLSADRLRLPEFEDYSGLVFEIQVRAVLQHAWAELAHDRSYKFSGVLPKPLERKLHLYAGMLELADAGFDELAAQIDDYSQGVVSRAAKGDLEIEINTPSISEYLPKKMKDLGIQLEHPHRGVTEDLMRDVISELYDFRVRTLAELDRLFTGEFVDAATETEYASTIPGLLRDAMMFSDLQRYFSDAWQERWRTTLEDDDNALLMQKYSQGEIEEAFCRYDVYA